MVLIPLSHAFFFLFPQACGKRKKIIIFREISSLLILNSKIFRENNIPIKFTKIRILTKNCLADEKISSNIHFQLTFQSYIGWKFHGQNSLQTIFCQFDEIFSSGFPHLQTGVYEIFISRFFEKFRKNNFFTNEVYYKIDFTK